MLAVLGASHHDLELGDIDRLSGSPGLPAALNDMVSAPGSPLAGLVLLATCNRIEVYLDADRFHDAIDAVTATIADQSRLTVHDVAELLRVRVGSPVAAHLFGVAAGLDSMVVGEAEISGQVARAHRRALAAGTTTPVLNRLFQSASRTAKRVAAGTGLGAAGRSVAAVALDLAAQRIGPLDGARVLLVGTGAYARVVAKALTDRGCSRLMIFSPSGRAAPFAARHQAAAIGAGGLMAALVAADLVVACSGTGSSVLQPEAVRAALQERGRTLSVIDLALRVDVPAEVRALPGVEVIDLQSTAARAGGGPQDAVERAVELVTAAVGAFEADLAARRLDPAVVALRNHVTGAVQREIDRLRPRVPAEVASEFEHAAHRLARSLLHTPTVRARMLARTGDESDYLQALHTLFGIEVGPDTHE